MPELLLSYLQGVAPSPVDVSILQPADPFLEMAGEDMRRRIFITETTDGQINCLRPEFTIPICLAHKSGAARYAYGGTVFRQNRKGSSEFKQAGLEDLGNGDVALADARCLADMTGALTQVGVVDPVIVLGDQNLFGVVVENLHLPPAVAARLVRNFGDREQISRIIDLLVVEAQTRSEGDVAQQLAQAGDEAGLIAHVSTMMDEANLPAYAGRSAEDIAERMLDKEREARFRLAPKQAQLLRDFLALEMPLAGAAEALAQFADNAGMDFGTHLNLFRQRVQHLQELGTTLEKMIYRASFGRKLDYYTGVLFEAEAGGLSVAGGGRYDRLCTLLGSKKPVPAVGFSISLDRVAEALQ